MRRRVSWASSTRLTVPVLRNMFETCTLTVFSLTTNARAISATASPNKPTTSAGFRPVHSTLSGKRPERQRSPGSTAASTSGPPSNSGLPKDAELAERWAASPFADDLACPTTVVILRHLRSRYTFPNGGPDARR